MAYIKPKPGDPMVFPKVQNTSFLRGLGKGGKGQRRVGYHGNGVDPTTYLRLSWESQFHTEGTPPAPNTPARYYTDFHEISEKAIASASNTALEKVDKKLRIVDSYWEDWYERQQAYSLLATTSKKLLTLLLNYKKKSYWKGLKADHSSLATLPELWLTYQFGIVPLMGTISRSLDVMGADFPALHVNGVGSFNTIEKHLTDVVPAQFRRYGGNYVYNTHSGRLIYGCRVTGVNPNRGLLGATGLNEPFSSAWAVIPWGWAVDYFVNASQLVSNLEPKHPGITVTSWYRTLAYTTNTVCASTGQPWNGWGAFSHAGKRRLMSRRPISAPVYVPELSFPLLGSNQAANLLSAIALTMKGSK